jgi:hypothetical protein
MRHYSHEVQVNTKSVRLSNLVYSKFQESEAYILSDVLTLLLSHVPGDDAYRK